MAHVSCVYISIIADYFAMIVAQKGQSVTCLCVCVSVLLK